ncbi:hypothetical protein [Streptacidiphilus cavernicola]|uniref:Uncharacterized protein n=1 Tax=Streptacidiphilus cavernicola TaxID=3342716 RepID=A0ABV6VY28_9ACTN
MALTEEQAAAVRRGQQEEKQRTEQLRSELRELGRELPGLLAGEWRADEAPIDEWNPRLYLHREDGVFLVIGQERLAAMRFNIHAALPQDGAYYYRFDIQSGTITVTRAKTAEQIAVDITRRLMPQLDAAMVVVVERQHEHLVKVAGVEDCVALLREVYGVEGGTANADDRRSGADRDRRMTWHEEPLEGMVRFQRSATIGRPDAAIKISSYVATNVEVTFHNLPPHVARAVLAAAAVAVRTPAPTGARQAELPINVL